MTTIETANEDALFASVLSVLEQSFSVFPLESGSERLITGIFGDVSLELEAVFVSGIPIVRAKCNIARRVPLTAALVEDLNRQNQVSPLVTVGIHDEEELPDTVRIRISASVFGEWITPASVVDAVQTCVWPANIVLQQGILARHGGELGVISLYRQLAESAELVDDHEAATGFRFKMIELEERVERGDVGRT